jgi:hypothetical protein
MHPNRIATRLRHTAFQSAIDVWGLILSPLLPKAEPEEPVPEEPEATPEEPEPEEPEEEEEGQEEDEDEELTPEELQANCTCIGRRRSAHPSSDRHRHRVGEVATHDRSMTSSITSISFTDLAFDRGDPV